MKIQLFGGISPSFYSLREKKNFCSKNFCYTTYIKLTSKGALNFDVVFLLTQFGNKTNHTFFIYDEKYRLFYISLIFSQPCECFLL